MKPLFVDEYFQPLISFPTKSLGTFFEKIIIGGKNYQRLKSHERMLHGHLKRLVG